MRIIVVTKLLNPWGGVHFSGSAPQWCQIQGRRRRIMLAVPTFRAVTINLLITPVTKALNIPIHHNNNTYIFH